MRVRRPTREVVLLPRRRAVTAPACVACRQVRPRARPRPPSLVSPPVPPLPPPPWVQCGWPPATSRRPP